LSRITISGTIGSGKSSTGEALAQILGYRFISGGQIFRQKAAEMGMTLEQFESMAEKDPSFDTKQNEIIVEFLRENDNIVLESRLSAFLAREAGIECFRIFLDADIDERARRFSRRESIDFRKSKRLMTERERSDSDRFRQFFHADHRDPQLYNAIIDTTHLSVLEAAERIYEKFTEWKLTERLSGN
jgi:predicted cytidylate kinase